MKIGIIQGRLSPPVGGHIQNFPQKTWRDEFESLDYLPTMPYYAPDVDNIEWIVTMPGFAQNPLFTDNLKHFPISSICVDSILDPCGDFPDIKWMDSYFKTVCTHATLKSIYNITVPLLENSSVIHPAVREEFLNYMTPIVNEYPLLTFSFEFEAPEDVIDDVLNFHPKFKMTYDTGNMTSFFGKDVNHRKLLTKYIDRIDNIHLKDRTFDEKTVEPGEGDTNFTQIFETLSELKYSGQFTLQTARGTPGRELITISRHLDYFFKLMEITEQ